MKIINLSALIALDTRNSGNITPMLRDQAVIVDADAEPPTLDLLDGVDTAVAWPVWRQFQITPQSHWSYERIERTGSLDGWPTWMRRRIESAA